MAIVFFTEGALGSSFASEDYNISSKTQQVLESLRKRGVQIGLILRPRDKSRETVNNAINRAKRLFDPELTIFNDLSLEQRLSEAAAKAKVFQGPALFVGKHNVERRAALKAGFDGVVPHPRLVSEVMDGGALIYARVSGLNCNDKDDRLNRFLEMPVVPVYFTRHTEAYAYVITSSRAKELITSLGFEVVTLGEERDPELTDLYLVRGERKVRNDLTQKEIASKFRAEQHEPRFELDTPDGLLLALPPDVDIHAVNLKRMRDGHSKRLLPDPTLLAGLATHPATAPSRPCLTLNPGVSLSLNEVELLQELIKLETIRSFHAPYVGAEPLVTGGDEHRIRSRHVSHRQNKIVTNALVEQFKKIGEGLLKVRPDPFDLGEDSLINVEAELPGEEADSIVIISAHLDSTADDVYDLSQYPAPGADDDASGMAAVLAAAQAAVRFTREFGGFRRSLRFVLFNAEENHILGSAEYAGKQAEAGAKIEGVFQMDMIGFEGGQKNVFEIHAGFPGSPATEKCSLVLAQRVREMADLVSKPLVNGDSPQIYPQDDGGDPAHGESDHTRFQEHGYAACMISEDHNPDPDPDPPPRRNPHYHSFLDEKIKYEYAAEIARAVIAAAFLTAKG